MQKGNPPNTAFDNLLTVMLPDISQDVDLTQRIRGMCKGIFASLAALEGLAYQIKRISMPVLQGHLLNPGEEYKILIANLIKMGARWLKYSKYTQEISMCVYYGDEINVWSETIDMV